MGGYLSQPADKYPSLFSSTGLFADKPFLLPCLAVAIYTFIDFVFAYFWLPEPKRRVEGDEVTASSSDEQDEKEEEVKDEERMECRYNSDSDRHIDADGGESSESRRRKKMKRKKMKKKIKKTRKKEKTRPLPSDSSDEEEKRTPLPSSSDHVPPVSGVPFRLFGKLITELPSLQTLMALDSPAFGGSCIEIVAIAVALGQVPFPITV